MSAEVDEGVETVDLKSDSTTQDLLEINKKWGTSIGSTRKVPYWIKKGEMFGYIQKGWSMMSYLRNTVIPARHEDEFKQGRYKEGFENVITWGRQGTKKCLVSDSLVLTPGGEVKIARLGVGDKVLSADGRTATVLGIGVTRRPVVEVRSTTGSIYSSPEHRFWTPTGWRQASNLIRGDRIRARGILEDQAPQPSQVRRWEEVRGVSRAGEEEGLYDITTSSGHFIADGFVVHNSNLNRQMMYAMLGDWRTVLDYMLMTKEQLYKIYHMTTDEGIRVPYVTIDDITTTIPKQLFFVGMQEFIRFQQFVATIRLRIGVVGSNTPLPENVISVLKDNVSMEVIVFPTTPTPSYMTERYCWFPHEFRACASYLRKVMVEYKTWDYRAEPYEIFHEYNERRWKITEEIVKKLQGDDSEPEQIIPQVDMKEFEKAIRICETCKCQSSRAGICVCETFIPRHRHAAIQLSNDKLRSVVASVLQTLQEKASTVSAQKKKDLVEVYGTPPSVFEDIDEPGDEPPQ